MSLPADIVVRGVVRALAIVVSYAIVFDDSTRDAVGIGLLLLPIIALFALLVSTYDGWRTGLWAGWAVWALAAVLVGFGVPAWDVVSGGAASYAQQVREYTVIVGLLTLVPAMVGAGLGALGGVLLRRSRSATRPVEERDQVSPDAGRQTR